MLPTCDRSKVKEEIYDRITISLANVLHYLSLLKKLPVVMFNLAKVVQFRNTVNQPYETKWVNLIILVNKGYRPCKDLSLLQSQERQYEL